MNEKKKWEKRIEKVEIKKLGINGEGVGYISKKICFIDHALPGELVEVEIYEENRKYMRGKVLKILKASSQRVPTFCHESQHCLGCSLTCMKYQQQLPFKQEILKDALRKYTDFDVSQLPIKDVVEASPHKNYKHVASLPMTYFQGKVKAGIYQRQSKYLVLMDHCSLHDPLVNQCIQQIEDILHKYHVRDYNDKIKKGLRFMKIRNIDQQIQVVFVTGKNGLKPEVTKEVSQIKAVKSIFYTVNTANYQDFELQGYKKIYGESRIPFQCFHQNYLYSIKSDFPINPIMEEQKLKIIQTFISSEQSILSIHCGVGLLELAIDNPVTAIDEKKCHIEDAKDNAKFLRKNHARFICHPIDKEVVYQCKNHQYDMAIVHKEPFTDKMKESFILSKIKDIIYVSEYPSEIAKNIMDLKAYYDIDDMIPIDMQPYSAKITTIIHLKRKF